jgi:hypothetical protein
MCEEGQADDGIDKSQSDSAAMVEEQKWFASQPEENFGLALASDTEAYEGHLGKARELSSGRRTLPSGRTARKMALSGKRLPLSGKLRTAMLQELVSRRQRL